MTFLKIEKDRKDDNYPIIKVAVFSLGLRLNEEKDGTTVEGVFKWSPWYQTFKSFNGPHGTQPLNDSNGPQLLKLFTYHSFI